MKIVYTTLFLACVISSCNSNGNSEIEPLNSKDSKATLVRDIKLLTDSLMAMYSLPQEILRAFTKEDLVKYKTNLSVARMELINLNLKFYKSYPEDTLSAYCLSDVQQLYDATGAFSKALSYGDTIASQYPDFTNLVFILEKNAAILDFNVQERDTAQIRKAYERIIALPNISKESKTVYLERIATLDIPLKDFLGK